MPYAMLSTAFHTFSLEKKGEKFSWMKNIQCFFFALTDARGSQTCPTIFQTKWFRQLLSISVNFGLQRKFDECLTLCNRHLLVCYSCCFFSSSFICIPCKLLDYGNLIGRCLHWWLNFSSMHISFPDFTFFSTIAKSPLSFMLSSGNMQANW